MTTQFPPHICILGGGFGGLYTALRLSQFPFPKSQEPRITLIDQRERFLFAPLLYELITGELESWEISPSFAELLASSSVNFHQGNITAINSQEKSVTLQDQSQYHYNYLVLSLGGETPISSENGIKENAIPFRTIADAYRLEEKLKKLENSTQDKIRIAIVGGGYSGVELACKLADRLGERGRIRLIEKSDKILQNSPEFNQKVAKKALETRQIWVDLETTATSLTADTISLVYKGQEDTLPVDIVLWTIGNEVNPVIKNLSLPKNTRGQILTKSTLQVRDYPEIFALGDLAEVEDESGKKLPTTAQVAIQQADYTAWNLWAILTGRPLLPFRYFALGEMLTLGKDHATLSGLGIELEGIPAHLIRRFTYLYRLPTFEHQIKVAFNWLARPLQDIILRDPE